MTKKLLSSLTVQIIMALFLGCLVGLWGGKQVGGLGDIGKVVIQLIKAVAVPMLFTVILHSFLTTDIDRKSGARLVLICAFNGALALLIGIGLSKMFHAGEHFRFFEHKDAPAMLSAYADKKIDFLEALKSYFPESLVRAFVDNAVISLVLMAVFFGAGLRHIGRHDGAYATTVQQLAHGLGLLQRLFELGLHWLVRLIPLAVFGVVAKTVGEYGFAPLKGLLFYLGVGILGLVLHIGLVYQGWALRRGIPLREFWKVAWPTVVYAFGVNSSLATLPLTLKSLQTLKVSKRSATLGAYVGTNLNNDGILLYEAMAVFFVAQASGIEMGLGQQVVAALMCVVGTIGVAGIPEAGFITLSLVLTTVGLPVEILPMLLTVDWLVGRMRSVTNVLGDMTVAIALDPPRGA